MKFHFKIQGYQTEAVKSVTDVFAGQPHVEREEYLRDKGVKKILRDEFALSDARRNRKGAVKENYDDIDLAFRNHEVELTAAELKANLQAVQKENGLIVDSTLSMVNGVPALDVEMETGTGKTYCYIKTMFELNRLYGWSKFIVVVPSVAIREGVRKSFQMTADHFMEHYGKKARFFIYDSKNLHQLDAFATNGGLNVMIINMHAFASSLKEGGKNKESRIIYSKRDEFASRRPIDVIAANRPILILDEPQRLQGPGTQAGIAKFKPLFMLHYSATHREHHSTVYALDALDAYNKRLVKKIQVKGIQVSNRAGTGAYLYLSCIKLSNTKPPEARMEIEVRQVRGVSRKMKTLRYGDNVYTESGNMEQYRKGYVVSEIDPVNNRVRFTNGVELRPGESRGDVNEQDIRRVQIHETIQSHFDKEAELFSKGVKTLSLFFIDEVAKYRQYGEEGEKLKGEYARIFEEEYNAILNERLSMFDGDYRRYLEGIATHRTHNGYFSIDKKTGRVVNSEVKRGEDYSDDVDAYDLILKDKERLLSFDEPTRFIFSHSALREGWDNPNVFQICTLKHSDNTTTRRQEVGRGLRLAVNREGTRMDADVCGDEGVHRLNKLTVIANESYADFVTALQDETRKVLYERPDKVTVEFFEGKTVKIQTPEGEQTVTLDNRQAVRLYGWMMDNGYVDEKDAVTEECRAAMETGAMAPLPAALQGMEESVKRLIQGVFDGKLPDDMVEDAGKAKVERNDLNDNFYREEFQDLWKRINHKYAYTVQFDSEELIEKALDSLEKSLIVNKVTYSLTTGEQDDELDKEKLERGAGFNGAQSSETRTLSRLSPCETTYDLVGSLAKDTALTRRTIAVILRKLSRNKLKLFAQNPEQFMSRAAALIEEQKATMVIDHITYNRLEETFDSNIFTADGANRDHAKAFKAQKHIQPYVFTDGTAEKSVERVFAEGLEKAKEVCVYSKLPRGFFIPTPVGNYTPDWAIAFDKKKVKHIFFIAETKGTLERMELRGIEQAKIDCAKKLFNEISSDGVKYHQVNTFKELMDFIRAGE